MNVVKKVGGYLYNILFITSLFIFSAMISMGTSFFISEYLKSSKNFFIYFFVILTPVLFYVLFRIDSNVKKRLRNKTIKILVIILKLIFCICMLILMYLSHNLGDY